MKQPQLVGQGATLEPGDVIEWNTEPTGRTIFRVITDVNAGVLNGRRGVMLNGALIVLPS